jgi:hypothetical protein
VSISVVEVKMITRVTPLKIFDLDFAIEPFPYTRLNINSRWTAGPGSQEYEYMAWKDTIRNAYEQLDYQIYDWGVPFHEPLSLSGKFDVTQNWEGKDLDNLMKGIVDALNPSRRKDWKDLKTHQWIDDKQVVQHTGFLKVPAKEPRILLKVSSLWGRVDPNLNYVEGPLGWNGSQLTVTTNDYPFNVNVVTDPETRKTLIMSTDPARVTEGYRPADVRMWIWPYSFQGQYMVFTSDEALLLYRIFHGCKGLSTITACQLLNDTAWESVLEGINSGLPKHWTNPNLSAGRAATALSKVRESLAGQGIHELRLWLGLKFEPNLFEKAASDLSQEYGSPWSSVRDRLRNANINWQDGDDPVYKGIVSQLATERDAREKAKKKK